jgi:hypothetical protein
MYNGTPLKTRPLTKNMINLLMECHERELMNQPPCEATFSGVKGLLVRKLLTPAFYTDNNGKRSLCAYLNAEGKKYLEEIIPEMA